MSIRPRRHRVNIPGRSQTSGIRKSSLRTVNPKAGPLITLNGTVVARILEENS